MPTLWCATSDYAREKKSIVKRKQPNRCTTYNPWTIEKWIFNTLSTFKEPRTEKKLKRLIWIRYRLHVYENMASELFANAVCTFYVLFVAPLGNANSALLHFNREKPSLHEKNWKGLLAESTVKPEVAALSHSHMYFAIFSSAYGFQFQIFL